MNTLPQKKDVIKEFAQAEHDGKFFTDKHNADSLSAVHKTFRSVIAKEIALLVPTFIGGGNYTLNAYNDPNDPKAALYLIIPPPGTFNVSGSGVPKHASSTSGTFDSFIVASGSQQAFHIYPENVSAVTERVNNGKWLFLGEVTDSSMPNGKGAEEANEDKSTTQQ